MKKFFIIFLIVLASCVRMEHEPAGSVVLTGILESDPDTRTYISKAEGGIYYPYWSGTERLAVYPDNAPDPERFVLSSGKDTHEASFSGVVGGDSYVAYYPYENAGSLQDNVLSFTLPAEQEFVSGTFADGSFPMLAVSNSTTLEFKNLCSVLKVSLTGESTVHSIIFSANDPQMPVSGKAYVRTDMPDNPVLKMAEGASGSVRLVCSRVQLSESWPASFMIVIPPGTYKGGFTLKIKTSEGVVTRTTDQDVVFLRSQIRSIPAFECKDAVVDIEDLPENMICYKTSSGLQLSFDPEVVGRNVISHTFEDGLGTIVFDGIVTNIAERAFYGADITDIYLPATVEKIGEKAFFATRLTSFRVPDKLSSVGYCAFGWCASLAGFHGPNTLEDGSAIVFNGKLVAYIGATGETISIPEGVISIESNSISLAAEPKERLREVILPEGLLSLGVGNFSGLPELEYVTLPSTYRTAWQGTFSNCPSLKKFMGACPEIFDGGNLLLDDQGYVSDYAGAGITDYVLPEGVLYLEDNVFEGKADLKSLTFPNSFIGIINCPFFGADNLSRFYGKYASEDGLALIIDGYLKAISPSIEHCHTPAGVTNIGLYVFGPKVKSITFDDSVTTINPGALNYARGLQTMVLPASLKRVGSGNFRFLSNLKTVYFRTLSPPACDAESMLPDFDPDLAVFVPQESLDDYKCSSSWSFLAPYMRGYDPGDLSEYYSLDGAVTVIQEASAGMGIDLVVMGDAFTREQIEDGTYGTVMTNVADAFFSVEPYKSFRHLFNVYRIDVVSQTDSYDVSEGRALGTSFGEGTKINGDRAKCLEYARFAVPGDRMGNVLVMVALNSNTYAGTCYMYGDSESTGDWAEGYAVAFFPLGFKPGMLEGLVHHEAGGHGFAKLEDEYFSEENGTIPNNRVSAIRSASRQGWYRNVDLTSDPSEVKWSRFLIDARYAGEGLGVFEGGATYAHGVYRPTETSIMDDNYGSYNAPSRYAIWYRIHKLAYGASWNGSYEDFVSWDVKNLGKASYAPGKKSSDSLPPLARPVVIEKSWREVLGE